MAPGLLSSSLLCANAHLSPNLQCPSLNLKHARVDSAQLNDQVAGLHRIVAQCSCVDEVAVIVVCTSLVSTFAVHLSDEYICAIVKGHACGLGFGGCVYQIIQPKHFNPNTN